MSGNLVGNFAFWGGEAGAGSNFYDNLRFDIVLLTPITFQHCHKGVPLTETCSIRDEQAALRASFH